MINKIVFYNRWHNGDIFSGKSYLREIIKSLPDIEFVYAHVSHHKVMADLEASHATDSILPQEIIDRQQMKYLIEGNILYLNTWVGAYFDVMLPSEPHGNYAMFHRMYNIMYKIINQTLAREVLILHPNPLNYVAETDFGPYITKPADDFVNQFSQHNRHLICNGYVRATQSGQGLMEGIIDNLADTVPNDIFICTAKYASTKRNVFFTDDIFQLENDINEIAYLSLFCSTIVGKNSGPYMFCHLKPNFNNFHKCFVSLSHRPADSYPVYELGFGCNYLHHCSDDSNGVRNAIYFGIMIDRIPSMKKLSQGRLMVV